MKAEALLALFERVADAPDAIPRLRRFVLDLAVRGKLVEQDAGDEPDSKLKAHSLATDIGAARSGRKSKIIPAGTDVRLGTFEIPATWTWVRIGDIFDYDAGIKREPSSLDPTAWLLELEDIEKETGRLLSRATVSERDSKSTKSEFSAGDILYGKLRPYLTKVLVADQRGYSTTEIVAIRPLIPMCSDYCALALRRPDFVDYVSRLGQGTKMPRLRTEDAVVAPFPLPPLAEQHRIVAKVDELMALLDRLDVARSAREATRDRLTTASLTRLTAPESDPETLRTHAHFALDALPALTTRTDQIKQLRQTILDLAVRGMLAPQILLEGAAVQGSGAAHEKIPFEAPRSWSWHHLGELAELINGDRSKNYPNRAEYQPEGIAWINTGHIQPDGSLSLSTMHYILREKFNSLRSGKILKDDLVYCLRGATFGKTGFVAPFEEGAIASSLMIIRVGEHITPRFTYLVLTSPLGRQQLLRFDNGTAQPNLSSSSVGRYQIPLPPLAEQHRIVAKVDELMALCDRLEAALQAADTTRARLLEELLHEALAGERAQAA